MSKKRAERSEYKSKAITSLQEHIDTVVSMISEGSREYWDLDQLADFILGLGEDCLLCEGKDKIIFGEVLAILKASREEISDTREGGRKDTENIINFSSRHIKG